MKKENMTVGFTVNTLDSKTGNNVTLHFTESGYAEQVLRGLVHSGFNVSIKEEVVPIPEGLLKIREHHNQLDATNRPISLRARVMPEGPWGEGVVGPMTDAIARTITGTGLAIEAAEAAMTRSALETAMEANGRGTLTMGINAGPAQNITTQI